MNVAVFNSDRDRRALALQQWYASSAGQNVWSAEKALLDKYLPNLFGYHLMTLGACPSLPLVTASPIHHCFALSDMKSVSLDVSARCHLYELPIESESVDVAVLHHSLGYSDSPHQLLRETARVMMPYGNVLVFGFQRWSALGLQYSIRKIMDKHDAVASYNFISINRIHDWLQLLDFDIVESRHAVYVPPQFNGSVKRYLSRLEHLGEKSQIPFGSVYFVLARKTVAGMKLLSTEKEKRKLNPLRVLTPEPAVSAVRKMK